MKRKLAIWMAWKGWSEYYANQIAEAISEYYDTTITYNALDWTQFDVVMPYFANRHPKYDKVVKIFQARHELKSCKLGRVNIVGCTNMLIPGRIHRLGLRKRDPNALLVPFGVNPKHFYPEPFPDGNLVVGWAGNPGNVRKNFPALKECIESVAGVTFATALLGGRGGTLRGLYEPQEMHQFYSQIHIYVCGSWEEGFCMPLLEAAACGRAIVTFDVGVARDLLDSGAGVVIVKNFQEMKEAVRTIDFRELGKKSAEAVRQSWLWEHVKDKWLYALDSVK